MQPLNAIRLLACLLCLFGSGKSLAAPLTSLKTNYYHIQGSSPRDLRSSLNRERPKGMTHEASTVWNVTWSYSWRTTEGGVSLHSPKVAVAITMTLPRWSPPKDAEPYLVERWQTYLRALLLHENGHTAIGVQAARDIEKQLAALPQQPTAADLKQLVETTCQQILAQARAKETKFDEDTQHGMKQGSRFP